MSRRLLLLFVVTACSAQAEPTLPPPPGETAPSETVGETAPPSEPAQPIASSDIYSAQPQDGNRWYRGRGSMTVMEPVAITVSEKPVWLGLSHGDGVVRLGALLDDGSGRAFVLGQEAPSEEPAIVRSADGPVSFVFGDENVEIVPHVTDSQIGFVTVDSGGIGIDDDGVISTYDLDPLPDGKAVVDRGGGHVAVLTGPTDRYPHGVLGDIIESSAVAIIDHVAGRVMSLIEFEGGHVAEATSPMWVDAGGRPGLLVTLSDQGQGARLALYGIDGELLAQSRAIGQGNRWRHQIGAAPLGPQGEYEIVDVLTPHIGGVVEFFRLEGGDLIEVAEVGGLTSHGIGSRNLDWMAIVDADGDGDIEVVGPTQDRRALGAVNRNFDGATIEWTLPLPGRLSTNLAVAEADGGVWVAAGTDHGIILVWGPP